jgi:ELL-associated factor
MAENFGIGPGPHELKIGSSFTGGRGGSKFQTIRYDFKPASVGKRSKGKVEIGEGNSLSVTVPHSNGTTETNYKGNLKEPGEKECVLIIDRHTGEITLEKLSGHMLLKKTRQATKQSAQIKSLVNNSEEIAAAESALVLADYSNATKPIPKPPRIPKTSQSNPANKSAVAANVNSSSRPHTPVSNYKRDSPAGTPKPISRSASPHIPINSNSTTLSQAAATVAAKVELSESSSSSSSSGSDSDSDGDSDDVPTNKRAPAFQQQTTTVNSMPSFFDSEAPSPPPPAPAPIQRVTPATRKPEKKTETAPHQRAPTTQSVPRFLNDDLQLSDDSSSDGSD